MSTRRILAQLCPAVVPSVGGGVRCDPSGGSADGFGVKAESSGRVSLERGMSRSTSGPVSGSFPKEGWNPHKGQRSLSYLHSKSGLGLPFLAVIDYSPLK